MEYDVAYVKKNMEKFVRRSINNAHPRPDWHKIRPDEIAEICCSCKNLRREVITLTAGGFPVYAMTYGPELPEQRSITWPSATGSPRPALYSQKPVQTILIAGGIHGEETEGISTILNLITLLETGKDLRGEPNPELVELCSHYRLVMIPCVNMDGRAVAPDCLMGCTKADYAPILSIMDDGTLMTWPALKEYFPMPMDRLIQLGSYYNADGYNIQLDAAPGNIKTAEANALLQLAHRERIDFFLNCHSATFVPHFIPPSALNYPENVATITEIQTRWQTLMGIPVTDGFANRDKQTDINAAMTLATGAPVMTFEFAALLVEPYENKLFCGYKIIKAVLQQGLEKPLCNREKLVL